MDVVLDVVGGDYLDRNLDCLATGGTIVQVGVMGGGQATFGLAKLLFKRASVVGTTLRARSLAEKVAVSRAFEQHVVPAFEDGRLTVVVDSRFALDEGGRGARPHGDQHQRGEDPARGASRLIGSGWANRYDRGQRSSTAGTARSPGPV
ncbi:MAG: hypothetical protein CM1200mP26_23140 [Acidimicrobiales bacterium]|nr:MAG: hypothetical protein CM1200mP26_23140 [Acidimicrobiales bacterium]